MRKKKLPEPTSQIQEVLYELIQRFSIDRRSMMIVGILNLPARILDLRNKGIAFDNEEVTGINKYGREYTFIRYKLKDKSKAIEVYLNLKENETGLLEIKMHNPI